MKSTRTLIKMRESTKKVKIISKTTNNYVMVMTLTPKQWEALINAKKPIVIIKGGDFHDPEMEIEELDEKEREELEGNEERRKQ